MIVCPWCGTNYAAFQSSCSKCGGPIQIPETAAPAGVHDVIMPSPPPREISERYLWKLLLSDAWAITAGIFFLIGGIFAFVGFGLTIGIVTAFVGLPFLGLGLLFLGGGGYVLYWRHRETAKIVNILRLGQAVRGQVMGAEWNYSVSVNDRHPLTIQYQFHAGGKEYQGKVTTLNQGNFSFQPGQSICVLYLAENPEYNSLYPHP